MSKIILVAVAVAAILVTSSGCAPTESAQHRALVSELSEVDAAIQRSSEAVSARNARIAALQQQLDGEQARRARYNQSLQSYMLNNKLAVAAIGLGLAGTSAALSDDGSVSQEGRAVGAGVGLLAAAYAIANADEVMSVFNELVKADAAMRAMKRNEQELTDTIAVEGAALEREKARLADIRARAEQVRSALATV